MSDETDEGVKQKAKITMDSGTVYEGWMEAETIKRISRDLGSDTPSNRTIFVKIYNEEGEKQRTVNLVTKKIESVEY